MSGVFKFKYLSLVIISLFALLGCSQQANPIPEPQVKQPVQTPNQPVQQPEKSTPVTKYLVNKNLSTYVSILRYLEKDGVMDSNEQAFIDSIGEYRNLEGIYPGFFAELVKLPDLSTIDESKIKSVNKLLGLASKSEYKNSFDAILNEGVREKRKVNIPFEMLFEGILSKNFESENPLKGYSAVNMYSWFKNTEGWEKYQKERLGSFENTVARMITPQIVAKYALENFGYVVDNGQIYGGSNIWASPKQTFEKKNGNCQAHSTFELKCLLDNGWAWDNFESNKDKATSILIVWGEDLNKISHSTCMYIEQNQFYMINTGIDVAAKKGIRGPFATIQEAAKDSRINYGKYGLYNLTPEMGVKILYTNTQ